MSLITNIFVVHNITGMIMIMVFDLYREFNDAPLARIPY